MAIDRQRGTVTLLFTDLEGSTDLRTGRGDDAAHQIIRIQEKLIRDQISAAGGTVAKSLGDGFMVLFTSARQALGCAISIQRAVHQHNQSDPSKAFKVRIGINTGEVVQEAEDVYGAAVNAASRICAKAQGGQILVSQVVKDLAGFVPDMRIVDRNLYWLKGFPQRWRLFEVMWREKDEDKEVAGEPVSAASAARAEVVEIPRAKAPIIGRVAELAAVEEEIGKVRDGRLRILAFEGEAGIGKTRLLEAAGEAAETGGASFGILHVPADEELRGPFFLFRTLFSTSAAQAIAEEAGALEALDGARDALTGRSQTLEGLSAQEQMLHVFDEVTRAVRSMAQGGPLGIFLDDLQWADEDSLRLLRYLSRTVTTSPILMVFTIRAATEAMGGGAMHVVSDLERMHLARRMRLHRFTRAESGELLKNLLASPVAPQAVEILHSRAEGVPFFIEEFARTYREAKVLQLVGGTWTMAKISGPSVPASVASLIERRLAQLEPEVRSLLADAAVLGRRFSVADLARIASSLEDSQVEAWKLEEMLDPALGAGILSELPQGAHQDYSFTHEQIREALVESQSRPRRRRIHAAIADILASVSSPDAANLTALAHHALQAGEPKRGVECSIRAARATLEAHAPEESVRIVDAARAVAATPEDRAELLRIKDDALDVLEKGEERAANLSEMAALAGAVGEPLFEMEVKLRRASAARMSGDTDLAAELATEVRRHARHQVEPRLELNACLELGQALMRSPLGEAFITLVEVDLEAAREAYERALDLARELEDRSTEAAVLRELGVIQMGYAKHRGLEMVSDPNSRFFDVLSDLELDEILSRGREIVTESLRIYEELGDRRGAMSALISLAYAHVNQPTRRGEAGRLEQVRRLRSNLARMTSESEKALDEAHMLFSIHVFARSHLIVDLALERGREGYQAARAIGDRRLEFLCAGGTALSHLSIGEIPEAEAWLDRAQQAALAAPGPVPARRLESWRGVVEAAKGEAPEAIDHLERAVTLATDSGTVGGRCETMALLAMEAAKLAGSASDPLLDRAERAAEEVRRMVASIAAETAWEAQAWAATSLVALERGEFDSAAEASRSALAALSPRLMRALHLDVLWVAARALIETGAPEAADLRQTILETLLVIDQSMLDPRVKEAWRAAPMLSYLVNLVGFAPQLEIPPFELDEIEIHVLKSLVSGKTDGDIAEELDREEEEVADLMVGVFEKVGVSSKTEATEYALRQGII